MEYIIGSLLTIATIVTMNLLLRSQPVYESKSIIYRQSHIFELVRPYVSLGIGPYKELDSQAARHQAKSNIKVLFTEQKAYWIKDNSLFEADVEGGQVKEESAKVVDTMALDRVQLNEIAFIVEKLTEGTNYDGGSPGKS
jgi:hypothetical protein